MTIYKQRSEPDSKALVLDILRVWRPHLLLPLLQGLLWSGVWVFIRVQIFRLIDIDLVWFYGISIIVNYLIPNALYK